MHLRRSRRTCRRRYGRGIASGRNTRDDGAPRDAAQVKAETRALALRASASLGFSLGIVCRITTMMTPFIKSSPMEAMTLLSTQNEGGEEEELEEEE
jgi:hypothetical protein